jgi:hypothetical protein
MRGTLTTKQVLEQIRFLMAQHNGSELELLEELLAEAEGWEMRWQELASKEVRKREEGGE